MRNRSGNSLLTRPTGIAACCVRAAQRPCRSRAAERSYQFPPSDNDWHMPLSLRGLPVNGTIPTGEHVFRLS